MGKLTIAADGSITSDLLTGEDLSGVELNGDVKAPEDAWIGQVNGQLGEVIGYSQVILNNYDDQGNRLVRKQNTNSGDLATDALYHLFDGMDMDVDVAVMNGGGIRNGALTGELTYLSCKEIHTYILRDLGGGFEMLRGAENVLDYVAQDYMVLADYIQSFPVSEETGLPTITAGHGYADPNGQGRITIITEKQDIPAGGEPQQVYVVCAGDSLWSIARRFYGTGSKWERIYRANLAAVQDPNLIRAGRSLVIPE